MLLRKFFEGSTSTDRDCKAVVNGHDSEEHIPKELGPMVVFSGGTDQ